MNMSLIVVEGKYGAIDADYSSCHCYYIIKFASSPYNLQAYLRIYSQIISSCEMLREEKCFFSVNINYHY